MVDSNDSVIHLSNGTGGQDSDTRFLGEGNPPRKTWWTKVKENTIDPQSPLLTWNMRFVISCLAVLFDPMLLYIPIINEENKCFGKDKTLMVIVIVLRSLTDFPLLLHSINQIRIRIRTRTSPHVGTEIVTSNSNSNSGEVTSLRLWKEREFIRFFHQKYLVEFAKAIARRMYFLSSSIIIDLITILPIPQVGTVFVFYKITGSGYLYKRTFLNMFIVFHYIPRICQIYLCRKNILLIRKWVKAAFNFFLYIVASHVLGACWYFFSIQRETTCWEEACMNTAGCMTKHCGETSSSTSIAFLNESCPINPPNATLFDFGIFLSLLQSGNTGLTHFPTKFFYTFWWGFRNLSNFGTNLETSSFVWENCFALLISSIGLLLFLYLIGNVQIYMQLATTKAEAAEEEKAKKTAPEELRQEAEELTQEAERLTQKAEWLRQEAERLRQEAERLRQNAGET